MKSCHFLISVLVLLMFGLPSPGFAASYRDGGVKFWLSPNLESSDYRALMDFNWNQNNEVQVFKFHSGNLNDSGFGSNNFPEFAVRNGFNRLRSFGTEIAIEVGAIKPATDGNPGFCNGQVWTQATNQYISKIESHLNPGQRVEWIQMDEPFYQTKDGCRVSFEQAVTEVVSLTQNVTASHPGLRILDIEPYPSLSTNELRSWVDSLLARGAPIQGLVLDVNREVVDIRTTEQKAALLDLGRYLQSKNLRFGMIYWGQRTGSDHEYAQDVLNSYVDTGSLRPYLTDLVFQNWHPSPSGRLDVPQNLVNANEPAQSMLGMIHSAHVYSQLFEDQAHVRCATNVSPLEYLSYYPDLRSAAVDPISHYLSFGAKEGRCPVIGLMPPGHFRIDNAPAVYNSNGQGAYCSFANPDDYTRAGGRSDGSDVHIYAGLLGGNRYDGACVVP